jgi:hypothetical protein
MKRFCEIICLTMLISMLFASCGNIGFVDSIIVSQKELYTGISPAPEGGCIDTLTPSLEWEPVNGAVSYELQLSDSESGLVNEPGLSVEDNSYTVEGGLSKGDLIFWRVRAIDSAGEATVWSEAFSFYVPEYFIGDTGPAGGFIFYHDELYSEDFQYYEAAPPSTEFIDIWWSPDNGNIEGADGVSIGDGMSNTTDILHNLGSSGAQYAALLCVELTHNSFDNWFLPSKNELHRMYLNLHLFDLGGFESVPYWSSTEQSFASAWYRNFDTDLIDQYGGKQAQCRVRAVRTFK